MELLTKDFKDYRDIEDFYRTIKVKKGGKMVSHKLFDYSKIWNDKALVFVVISERAAKGKSTQAKKLARDLIRELQFKTWWVMNTEPLIKNEKRKHLSKPQKYVKESFSGLEIVKGENVYYDKEIKDSDYTKFVRLGTAENEKGSRDDVALGIYDEINVGVRQIGEDQSDLFSSLIGTLEDPVNADDSPFRKFIMHANLKSLNLPLLIDLGITAIEDDLTIIEDEYGNPLIKILCPQLTEADKKFVEDSNKGNLVYQLQKKMGKEGHVYFNENLKDEVNWVDKTLITSQHLSINIIKIGKTYYEMRVIADPDRGKVIFFNRTDKDTALEARMIYALNVASLEEGIILNTTLKRNIRKHLANKRVFFSDIPSRENIIKELKK